MKNRKIILLLILVYFFNQNISGQYKKVNSNDLDIYYRIIGEGTPMLIVGGGPGDSSDRYLSLCDFLSKDFKCVLVEQRGCGISVPEVYDSTTISIGLTLNDFELIREQLGIKQWLVLGFSYGGYLASLYAHFYPTSFSSLILMGSMGLNTDVFGYFFDNMTYRLQQTDLDMIEFWSDSARVAKNPKHAMVERIRARVPGSFYDRKKSLILSQEIEDSHFNFQMGEWIWKDAVKRNLDLIEMGCNFNGQVLILHGRQDPLGESIPIQLSNYYKNSKLVFIEKSGHYQWIEQPEKVYSAIDAFINEVEVNK